MRRVAGVALVLCAVLAVCTVAYARTCPEGHPCGNNWKFCETCGARLGTAAKPPPPAPKPVVRTAATAKYRPRNATVAARAEARDCAVREAARSAVQQIARRQLTSAPSERDREAIKLVCRLRTDQLATSLRVGKVAEISDGTIQVWISADVKEKALASLLATTLGPPDSIAVMIPEYEDGKLRAMPQIEAALCRELLSNGATVVDVPQMEEVRWRKILSAALSGKQGEALVAATAAVAPILVTGRAETSFSQDNMGIISYRGQVQVRAVNSRTGEIMLADDAANIRGFGASRQNAAQDALQRTAEEIAGRVASALCKQVDQGTPVRLVGRGFTSDGWADAITTLKQITDVAAGGGTEATCRFAGGPAHLAVEIDRLPGLQVVDVDKGTIWISREA